MATKKTSTRIAELLLTVRVDKNSVVESQKSLKNLITYLETVEQQGARVNTSMSKQARELSVQAREAAKAAREAQRLAKEQQKLGQDTDKTTEAVKRQNREQARGGSSFGAGAGRGNPLLRSIGTDIRNLPAVPIPGTNISTDVIGKVLNTLGRLDVGLKELAISGGLAVGAVVAVALALENYKKTLAPVETLLRGIVAAQQDVAGILSSGRPQDIVDRQKAAQEELVRLEAQRAKALEQQAILTNELVNKQQSPDLLRTLFGNPAEAAFDLAASGPLNELQAQITDYNAKLAAQQVIVGELNKEIEEATRLLEAERAEKERLRLLDAAAQVQLQTILQAEASNAQAIRERIDALNFEQAAILKLMQTNEISIELSEQLTQRSRDISVALKAFSDALPEKERLEAARALFDKIKDGISQFVEDTAKRFADLKKVTAEIGEIKSEFKQKITDIQNKLAEQLIEATRDRDIALSEASREADMARTEAVREAGLERAEIERDSQLAVQRILRRSKLDINQAIQDRDAVALDAARARRDEELAAEEGNRAERLRKLDIELREQLRTIDIRLREQNRTIAMRYDEQVRRAQLAAQKSIEIETLKHQKELALKVQEVQRLLGLEQQKVTTAIQGATQTLGITMTFWQNMVLAARNAVSALGNSAAKVVKPSGRPNASSGGKIPTMDTGGRILSDGLIFAHKGEFVTNPKRGQGMGNIVFAPQINGMSRTQIRREVLGQLDRFIEENIA